MKGRIENGRVILEMSGAELRTLFCSVDREIERELGAAARMEQDAEAHVDASFTRGARVRNLRAAGELRREAAGRRALARDATDLQRILRQLTTDPDVR
ncbi:MAG TPA: hypothetical protein VJZ73_13360 [Methylomirabilota bacterium]|nr:hypothetical protein [Methylomirabilota bacterium]